MRSLDAGSRDARRTHQEFADAFTEVMAHVDDWDAPTPVQEWQARDVVNHLIEWLPPVLESASGIKLTSQPAAADEDPTQAWNAHCANVQAVLDDPELAEQVCGGGPFAGTTVADTLDRIYGGDLFMHRWDLARSAGVEANLDPAFCNDLVQGLSAIEDMLRESGQYGPRVAVDADAGPEAQLAGFIGRDPNWSRPA